MESKIGLNHGAKAITSGNAGGSHSSSRGRMGVAEGMRYLSVKRQWDEEPWDLLLLTGHQKNGK